MMHMFPAMQGKGDCYALALLTEKGGLCYDNSTSLLRDLFLASREGCIKARPILREEYSMAEENMRQPLWAESLEQWQKLMMAASPFQNVQNIWKETLEPYDRLMTRSESYLKTSVEALERFQKALEMSQAYLKTRVEALEQFKNMVETIQPVIKALAESLELQQKMIATSEPYLKAWTESFELYRKMMESSFPHPSHVSQGGGEHGK